MPLVNSGRRAPAWKSPTGGRLGFIDPASIAIIVSSVREAQQSGGSVFDIFGPSGGFQERQAIRDQYNTIADRIKQMYPTMPPSIRPAVGIYLGTIDSVIARGATASDLADIQAKSAEWESTIAMLAATPGAAFDLAGFPWYVWLIAAGVIVPLIIKGKGR